MQAGVAEGGQSIGRNDGISVLSGSDDGGHVILSLLIFPRFYH
jgi:hypothetical protein